jgi:hypothetical protein
MSKSELHDWEYAIEKLSGNNADKMLDIAQDIYNTAFVRGKNYMTLEQEPKTGHWIMTNDYLTAAYGSIDYVKCSCCCEESLEEGNYCPNCGAKMEVEEE